jgi:hypothetical protein
MAGDVNDAGLPKISRSITFSRAVPWEVMSKKISSPFAMSAIEKSISVSRLLHGSACESRTAIFAKSYFGSMTLSPLV